MDNSICLPRRRRGPLMLFAGIALLLALAPRSQAADVLYATGVGTGQGAGLSALYSIDPSTGAATLLWNYANIHIYGGGLAYDAASDSLYASGTSNNSEDTLYRLNRFTGEATAVGLMGPGLAFGQGGMSIDPTTGLMYATTINQGPNTGLYSVNKATGATSLIGQASGSFTVIYGLGFRQDGALFANGRGVTADSFLYSMDPSSGATVEIGPHGVSLGRELAYSGLAFQSDGTLLSLGSITASRAGLYSVNPSTGAATLIGDTVAQFGEDGGLAFAPGAAVPEPGTVAVIGLGLAGCLRRRKNSRKA